MSKKSILNTSFNKMYCQLIFTAMGNNVMNEHYGKKEEPDNGMLVDVVKEFKKKDAPVKNKAKIMDPVKFEEKKEISTL